MTFTALPLRSTASPTTQSALPAAVSAAVVVVLVLVLLITTWSAGT